MCVCVCVCVSLYVLIAYPQQATSRVSRDREFGDFAGLRTARCAPLPYVCIGGEGSFAILMSAICALQYGAEQETKEWARECVRACVRACVRGRPTGREGGRTPVCFNLNQRREKVFCMCSLFCSRLLVHNPRLTRRSGRGGVRRCANISTALMSECVSE